LKEPLNYDNDWNCVPRNSYVLVKLNENSLEYSVNKLKILPWKIRKQIILWVNRARDRIWTRHGFAQGNPWNFHKSRESQGCITLKNERDEISWKNNSSWMMAALFTGILLGSFLTKQK
jgi:hypothetical protein